MKNLLTKEQLEFLGDFMYDVLITTTIILFIEAVAVSFLGWI